MLFTVLRAAVLPQHKSLVQRGFAGGKDSTEQGSSIILSMMEKFYNRSLKIL
jgi:hypothetical protein